MIALPCVSFVISVVRILGFRAAAPAKPKHFHQRLRQIEAARRLPRQPFEVDEVTLNILHRLAACAHQVMMRFKISFH